MWWPPSTPPPAAFLIMGFIAEAAGGILGRVSRGLPARRPWGACSFKHEPYHLGSSTVSLSSAVLLALLLGVGSWRPSWSSSSSHHARWCWELSSCLEAEASCCGLRGRGEGRQPLSLQKMSHQKATKQMTTGSNLTLAAFLMRNWPPTNVSVKTTMPPNLGVGMERLTPLFAWILFPPSKARWAQLCPGSPSPASTRCLGLRGSKRPTKNLENPHPQMRAYGPRWLLVPRRLIPRGSAWLTPCCSEPQLTITQATWSPRTSSPQRS